MYMARSTGCGNLAVVLDKAMPTSQLVRTGMSKYALRYLIRKMEAASPETLLDLLRHSFESLRRCEAHMRRAGSKSPEAVQSNHAPMIIGRRGHQVSWFCSMPRSP